MATCFDRKSHLQANIEQHTSIAMIMAYVFHLVIDAQIEN